MKSHKGCSYTQNASEMRQLLDLLSYRGRFHPTKSLPYLAKRPRSSGLPQASHVGQPIAAPFLFYQAAREAPSHQAPVETLSPTGGSIAGSVRVWRWALVSASHQHPVVATRMTCQPWLIFQLPLRTVQPEIGSVWTTSPLGGKH